MNDPDRKKCILCIDDDTAMHTLLEKQLVVSGYDSLHAISGQEALQALKEKTVDLIILDINMPNMDGFQILRHLKMENGTQDIPVIFLSSLSRENLKVKGLEHGADDFIVKPFTGPELIARIKAVLRRNEPRVQQPAGDVHGSLEDLGLFELLHMLSFSGKAAVITFPEMEGEMVVANSSILSVHQGSWRGKEALLRLFFLEKGAFTIVYEQREGEGIGGIESLLLFIGSTQDEIHDLVNSLAPEGTLLHLVADVGDFPEISGLTDLFPISLPELILSMPADLKANLDCVQDAVQKKVIEARES